MLKCRHFKKWRIRIKTYGRTTLNAAAIVLSSKNFGIALQNEIRYALVHL